MRIIVLLILTALVFPGIGNAQNDSQYDNFIKYFELSEKGDFLAAEKCMQSVVDFKDSVPETYLIAAYNNLGSINTTLGRYEKSYEYYNLAEAVINNNSQYSIDLARLCSNRARSYNIQRLFPLGIEYLEKAIRIYKSVPNPGEDVLYSLSVAYLNLGISYYGLKDYETALKCFRWNTKARSENKLPIKPFAYLNIANIYVETGDSAEAEEYFLKSIYELTREFGNDFHRLPDVYYSYSKFLCSEGRTSEALDYQMKALGICIKVFGNKHPYLATAYLNLGDNFALQKNYRTALNYYQKALISAVRDFNNSDILSNPPADSSYFDLDLVGILQKKSEVLEKLALQQNDTSMRRQIMSGSYESVVTAITMMNNLHENLDSEDARLFLMENEKGTYFTAIRVAQGLFKLTGNIDYCFQSFNFADQYKSSELKYRITGNELFSSVGIPDSIQLHLKIVLSDIAMYNHLIHEEAIKVSSDSVRINSWKETLFRLNREKDLINSEIDQSFPQYRSILNKTAPVSISEIQKNLEKGETLVEYFLRDTYVMGQKDMFTFIVTEDSINVIETVLDSSFYRAVRTIKQGTHQSDQKGEDHFNEQEYIYSLNLMYLRLIEPCESRFDGERLIIIPDEEITYLPFDAFIKDGNDSILPDFGGLHYLIRDYSLSYNFSSSLLVNRNRSKPGKVRVYAYFPDYTDSSAGMKVQTKYLAGAVREINSVFQWFKGKRFIGKEASESNFRKGIEEDVIFHLAMHSLQDQTNSEYSYLLFNPKEDTVSDGRLYNYEVGISRMRSPMVLLSACNTGSGTLYHTEGLMSMARGFILAGASSVIKTLWEVNDDAGSIIISGFYSELHKGTSKDKALQQAKLNYLKNSPPTYADPYFWAAYQVTGDNSPIETNPWRNRIIAMICLLLISGGFLLFYFKRFRIFSARSR